MGDRSLHCVHRNDLAPFDLRSHSTLLVSLRGPPYLSTVTRLQRLGVPARRDPRRRISSCRDVSRINRAIENTMHR